MVEGRKRVLAAITARITALKRIRTPWLQDARNRIQRHGLAALLEVKYVDKQGCRVSYEGIHGRPPESDAERMRFNRDVAALESLESLGLVTITHDGPKIRYVRPAEPAQ